MKKLLLLSLIALYTKINAQNIGIGNPSPAEKLDVTGNINVTGTIKANGVGGIAGQVLSKNESNNLAWMNTAYSNNIRFKTGFTMDTEGGSFLLFRPLRYNLNPSQIIFTGNTITLSKAGLYHFDVVINTGAQTPSNPASFPFVFLDVTFDHTPPHDDYNIYRGPLTPFTSDNSNWHRTDHVNFEQYLPANTTIRVRASSLNTTLFEVEGYITGHLISE